VVVMIGVLSIKSGRLNDRKIFIKSDL
jgi:hypothetical protein